MRRFSAIGAILILVFALRPLPAAEWARFRGPGGLGHGEGTGLPTEWSANKNVAWKTALPGAGSSSPIVLKGRIYLTSYSGYGVDAEKPGEMANLKRHVICIDRTTGKILWTRDFKSVGNETRYRGRLTDHGYATSTLTTDGRHLYAFFGRSGVFCLDLKGETIWRASVGERTAGWGSSNSPVLYNDLVIVNASIESGSLVALDKKTGKEKWRIERIGRSWSTPILVQVKSKKRTELVVSTPGKVLGIDPDSGRELWNCEGIPDRYVCPSPVAHNGVVYVIGGRTNTSLAIRAGGAGDVTKTHRLWIQKLGANVSSPVYHDGHIYWMHERRGTLYCLDAKTGNVVFRERARPRPGTVYSSVTVADGKLYCASKHNGTFVFAASPKFKLLAHNEIGDKSRCNSIPVVSAGQLLLRTDRHLYCIGKTKRSK